jgi:hypothetical protein
MAGGGFFGGLADGIAAGRASRQAKQNAQQQAAHQAFTENLQLKKLQLEQEQQQYERQKDAEKQHFEREKHDYTKSKDSKDLDLNERKFDEDKKKNQTEAEFKKTQEEKMIAETKRISQSMTKEQLEMQHAYFATWMSMSPQQQTEEAKKVLIDNAYHSGMIDEKTAERMHKHNLQSFNIVARAGLGMSAKALELKKYEDKKREGPEAKNNNGDESKLRQEFIGQSKDYQNIYGSYSRIKESVKNPSPAGDIALVYNYMKMLDPGSVVREGEFATAANAGGIPDKIRVLYNKAISGEKLTENIRADFLERSEMLYGSAKKGHEKLKEQYKGIAKRSGVNPDNVTVDYEAESANPTAGAKYKLPSGTVVDEATIIEKAKSMGISPEEALNKLKAAGATPISMEGGPYQGAGEPQMQSSGPTTPEQPIQIVGVRG